MNINDYFYRAYRKYREELLNSGEIASLRDAVASSEESENLSVIRTVCTIQTDWLDAIERGLVFIGKSIDEDRQFILSHGEVMPIEKVKSISRESVEHLARHSNLITREQTGEDLIPDKLYTVERLSNYAVYENRFLYMLLNMIKDFVSVRYNNIVRFTNAYIGRLTLKKTVFAGKRRLKYFLNLIEESDDDYYIRSSNNVRDSLNRLELIQRTVHYYLNTPLMSEMAKADKLKPPITKTNPLRMDKNLKETVVLYEFLLSYRGAGYTIKREERSLSPISANDAADLSDPALLASFMLYSRGLGLGDHLKSEYEKEEARRREEERLKLDEQLAAMRARIQTEGGAEQYIRLLEEKNRRLEEDTRSLSDAIRKADELESLVNSLNASLDECRRNISDLSEKNARDAEQFKIELAEERRKTADEAAARVADRLRAEEEKREELNRAAKESDERINRINARVEEEVSHVKKLQDELEEVQRLKTISDARLTAVRKQRGLIPPTEDFTSEEAFSELEKQFIALGELIHVEWKDTKKLLRRDLYRSLIKVIKGGKGVAEDRTEANAPLSGDNNGEENGSKT